MHSFPRPVRLAKLVMRLCERTPPSLDHETCDLAEIFQHPRFLHGTESERREVMWKSAWSKFRSEHDTPWDAYFDTDLSTLLRGRRALDLGCFTGGRGVAWLERYRLSELVGVDVALHFAQAARQFASARGARAAFVVGQAEALPFRDGEFEAILSCDVLEHVQSVERTLHECYRVLAPGGVLVAAFPGFYHPAEHHLSLVTALPGVHYLFTAATAVEAYNQIVAERGAAAAWYRRSPPTLQSWERGNGINGTSARRLRGLLRTMDWQVVTESRIPVGRRLTSRAPFRLFGPVARVLARLPLFEEVLVNRIAWVLRRPG